MKLLIKLLALFSFMLYKKARNDLFKVVVRAYRSDQILFPRCKLSNHNSVVAVLLCYLTELILKKCVLASFLSNRLLQGS
jgi:hypothetical protein